MLLTTILARATLLKAADPAHAGRVELRRDLERLLSPHPRAARGAQAEKIQPPAPRGA